jgi:hypothetical protein
MTRKVLVIPVGIYQERVWKSLVRSGAQRIYLIWDSKPEYCVTKDVARDLETRIKGTLMADVIKIEADFSDIEDIYRVFTYVIEKERSEDPFVQVLLDTTSTTKEAWHVASNLADAYGYAIAYVPGMQKISEKVVRKRYELEKDDPGGEVEIFLPTLSMPTGNPLSESEISVLCKVGEKMYNSVSDLIVELAKHEGLSQVDDAYEKRFLRVVRGLEERRLLIGAKANGRTKSIQLTKEGRGIAKGLIDAKVCSSEKSVDLGDATSNKSGRN